MPPPLHSTPTLDVPPAPLPSGVVRCAQCTPDADLASCNAVQVYLRAVDRGRSFSVIVWRDRPPRLRPLTAPRITALRPGDMAGYRGEPCVVEQLEVWR